MQKERTPVPPIPVPAYPKKLETGMASRCKRILKKTLRMVRSTLGLMFILVAYSFAGAALFQYLEGRNESEEKKDIIELRESIIDRVFYTSRWVISLSLFPEAF